jgi:ribosomal protein S18 acetylase RimI-like enzyme
VDGICLRRWKMETEAEQSAYVSARNHCFPESPISLEEWQYFMSSPLWAVGTMVAAFDQDRLAGCVSAYWNEEDNRRSGVLAGFTEDIFVMPAWRGRGIASAMIADGLGYLKDHGLAEARLMVRALNETALGLYCQLGFEVSSESRFYARDL